jgi:hypothetical protein
MLLDSPTGRRFFNALDALGWMVVQQRPGFVPEGDRWPVPFNTRAKWPSWCNHEFAHSQLLPKPQRPKLRLVEMEEPPPA